MKNITFLVFNSFDNSSYCQDYYCTSYKDATEQHLGYITGHSNNMGKITHDNVIAWEDGTFTVLSVLNGHIQDSFESWVK